jgi:hypothetical protein
MFDKGAEMSGSRVCPLAKSFVLALQPWGNEAMMQDDK